MWVCELKLWHKGSAVLELSSDINAEALTYYLNFAIRKGKIFITKVAFFVGKEKENLMQTFYKDPRIKIIAVEGNQMFFYYESSLGFAPTNLDVKTFLVKPISIRNGFEYWNLASLKKTDLLSFVERLKKLGKQKCRVEVLSIKKQYVNFFTPSALESLTQLQKQALQNAFDEGYYNYPRTKSLQDIAKTRKTARTTFQNHLRKAERKALEALMGQAKVV